MSYWEVKGIWVRPEPETVAVRVSSLRWQVREVHQSKKPEEMEVKPEGAFFSDGGGTWWTNQQRGQEIGLLEALTIRKARFPHCLLELLLPVKDWEFQLPVVGAELAGNEPFNAVGPGPFHRDFLGAKSLVSHSRYNDIESLQ